MDNTDFAIIGAGLAGCECALALARAGFTVSLFEQKPEMRSPAHNSAEVAELVCSNSLRSQELTSGPGLLKTEMADLGSSFMECAHASRVPADRALAVDRELFSSHMATRLAQEPKIHLIHAHIASPYDEIVRQNGTKGIIIAAGPLASDALSSSLAQIIGQDYCYFYDAIAPIVWTDSLDMNIVFRASRHQPDGGDYLNCPFNREEYFAFYEALLSGRTFSCHNFEEEKHFEGCMPLEALAARGPKTLSFGPLKPVGFTDPRTGKRPWAVLQLRAENSEMTTCNLVGCQTKLLHAEQERIFRMVPGLAHAEFARFGSMHRNTFVNAPKVLNADLSLKADQHIFLIGQLTGVEGYIESAATGLWLGTMLGKRCQGLHIPSPPPETAIGSLLCHLQKPASDFQPSNINFGLFPPIEERLPKKNRKEAYTLRARTSFENWIHSYGA